MTFSIDSIDGRSFQANSSSSSVCSSNLAIFCGMRDGAAIKAA